MTKPTFLDVQPNYGQCIDLCVWIGDNYPGVMEKALCATNLLKPTSRVRYAEVVTPRAISRQALDIAIRTGVSSNGKRK